jgi:hypothetical protein
VCYLCWENEYRRKREYIQITDVKKYNNELRVILTKNIPDAIILIDDAG